MVIERPQPQYILAVDESMHVSEDIVRSVSRALGTGHVHKLTKVRPVPPPPSPCSLSAGGWWGFLLVVACACVRK